MLQLVSGSHFALFGEPSFHRGKLADVPGTARANGRALRYEWKQMYNDYRIYRVSIT